MSAAAEARVAVRVADLAKNLGYRPVLRGLTLEVSAGEMVAVLGANGAGKSTLLKVLATIYRPTSGQGFIMGRSLETERDAARAVTGYLGHGIGVYDGLTCTENLHLVGKLYGLADVPARVGRAIERAQLEAYAHTMVRHLSKGLARRLALERALLHEPALLLLDEPYDGLDPSSQERLSARLRALVAGGTTVLLVTHDLDQARELCSRAVILGAGKVRHDLPTSAALSPAMLQEAAGQA